MQKNFKYLNRKVALIALVFITLVGCGQSQVGVLYSSSYKFYPGLPSGEIKYDYSFKVLVKKGMVFKELIVEGSKIYTEGLVEISFGARDTVLFDVHVRYRDRPINNQGEQTREARCTGTISGESAENAFTLKGCASCVEQVSHGPVAVLVYTLKGKEYRLPILKFDKVKSIAAP